VAYVSKKRAVDPVAAKHNKEELGAKIARITKAFSTKPREPKKAPSHMKVIEVADALRAVCLRASDGFAEYSKGQSDEKLRVLHGVSIATVMHLREQLFGKLRTKPKGPSLLRTLNPEQAAMQFGLAPKPPIPSLGAPETWRAISELRQRLVLLELQFDALAKLVKKS